MSNLDIVIFQLVNIVLSFILFVLQLPISNEDNITSLIGVNVLKNEKNVQNNGWHTSNTIYE